MAVPFSNTKLRVPKGFQNVLEGLAREVLRCQPDNIYSFSAAYFEELLRKRQETGYDDVTLLGAKLEDRFYNNHSFKNPSLNINSDDQQSAAVAIQSEYRRFAAKKEVDALKEEEAATVIQASVRGYMDRTSGTGEEINLPAEVQSEVKVSEVTISVDRKETQEKSEDGLKVAVTKESKEKSDDVGAPKPSTETTSKEMILIESNEVRSYLGKVSDVEAPDNPITQAIHEIPVKSSEYEMKEVIGEQQIRVKSSMDEVRQGVIQEQQEFTEDQIGTQVEVDMPATPEVVIGIDVAVVVAADDDNILKPEDDAADQA